MQLKFVTVNGNVFQLLGTSSPDHLPGLRPWTPLGDFNRPTDLLSCAVLELSLKIFCCFILTTANEVVLYAAFIDLFICHCLLVC